MVGFLMVGFAMISTAPLHAMHQGEEKHTKAIYGETVTTQAQLCQQLNQPSLTTESNSLYNPFVMPLQKPGYHAEGDGSPLITSENNTNTTQSPQITPDFPCAQGNAPQQNPGQCNPQDPREEKQPVIAYSFMVQGKSKRRKRSQSMTHAKTKSIHKQDKNKKRNQPSQNKHKKGV